MSTETLKALLEQVAYWPNEDKQELLDYALVIEGRRSGCYAVTNEERVALVEGMEQADRGEFIDEATVAGADKRHGS